MCLSEGCNGTNDSEPLVEEEIEEVKHMSRTAEQSLQSFYTHSSRYCRTRKNVRVMKLTVLEFVQIKTGIP